MKHFAFFLLLLLIIYGLGNFYVLYRGYQWSPFHGPCLKWVFIIWGALMMLSLPLMNMVTLPWPGVHAFWMRLSYTWMVLLLYALMLVVLVDLTGMVLRLFRTGIVLPMAGRAVLWFSVLALLLGLLLAGNFRYRHFTRKEVHFGLSGSVKMVAISDLHLGLLVDSARLEQFVGAINKEKPDVILVVGDLIDRSLEQVKAQNMGSLLQQLEAPMGIYAVPGNHEFYAHEDEALQWIAGQGIVVLRDSVVRIPGVAYILGREDHSVAGRKTLRQVWEASAYASRERDLPLLVLDHQPLGSAEAVDFGTDFQLSGHTHGGQLWPVSLLVRQVNDLFYGEYTRGTTRFYVTSGLGIWGPPFRIGVPRSEYVVIR